MIATATVGERSDYGDRMERSDRDREDRLDRRDREERADRDDRRSSGMSSTSNHGNQALDLAGLNPRYTFETFVKGASNQFALAAALRVAETPGRSYNPLFIYGSAGLGKTHLLHAIGHYVHHHYQHDIVRYVSTETFLNEYVDAIRTNTIANFKRRYRDIDVLLIDDIQFMEGKEGLQEEFFHTFNSLHGANKQIVMSSDRMPDAIPTLEERLRGRFKWGLITDIQPPDLETRLAILRNKAERDRSPVPAETLEFIASHITTNIRELEGALIRVTAYASLNHVPITTDLAEQLLGDLLTGSQVKTRTDEELLAEIAVILGFSVEALRGKSRQRPLVTARQIAMYVFRELTDLSLPEHRPPLRRPRPHHRHPRRRQDPAADEGTQADLRPGDRPRPTTEDQLISVGTTARTARITRSSAGGNLGTNVRSRGMTRAMSTEAHACGFLPVHGGGQRCARRNRPYAAPTRGCPQSTALITSIVFSEHIRGEKG